MDEFEIGERVIRHRWFLDELAPLHRGKISAKYYGRPSAVSSGVQFYDVSWDDGTITHGHLAIGLQKEPLVVPTCNVTSN